MHENSYAAFLEEGSSDLTDILDLGDNTLIQRFNQGTGLAYLLIVILVLAAYILRGTVFFILGKLLSVIWAVLTCSFAKSEQELEHERMQQADFAHSDDQLKDMDITALKDFYEKIQIDINELRKAPTSDSGERGVLSNEVKDRVLRMMGRRQRNVEYVIKFHLGHLCNEMKAPEGMRDPYDELCRLDFHQQL